MKLWNRNPGETFKMKTILYVLIILCFTSINIYTQQRELNALKLNDAISMTLKNYPLIKQAQQNVDVFDARIKQQESFNYPVINAQASYTRIGPIPSIGLPGAGTFELAPENNYDAHLAATYNLLDFGKKSSQVNLAQAYKNSAVDNVDLVKSNLAFTTVQTFYSILFLERSIEVNDTDVATLNEHINITNKKIESGTATDYDLLSTKVRLADYQSNKVILQNQLNNQKIILGNLTGLNNKDNIELSGEFAILTTNVNLDSLTDIAYKQRPEIKLAMDQENTALIKKNLASLGDMPDVYIQVKYGLANGFEPNLDVLRGNWAAGIGVSVPIFNGFKRKYNEEEADAGIKVSETNTENVKLTIAREVQTAAEDINSNIEQLKTAELKIKLAEESLQRARAQYSSGVGTNLDLLDAETRLADAKFLYLREIYQNILNTYELKKAVGDIVW